MFLRYRIMKKLQFGEYTSFTDLCKMFPYVSDEKIGTAIDILGQNGFIQGEPETVSVMYASLSSFREFKCSIRKAFFDTSVSLSAIVVAIATVLELWQ